jgi:hypothetical protein
MFNGLAAGGGYIVPSGKICVADIFNAVADRKQPSRRRSEIREETRQMAVALVCRAASERHLKLRWPDGCSPPHWYWDLPIAEKTIELGVFRGPGNEEWRPYEFKPMFATIKDFERWFATVPSGDQESEVLQPSDEETIARERRPASPPALLAFDVSAPNAAPAAEGTDIAASETAVDPYRSGMPGRPTISHLIKGEFERRRDANITERTLEGEAAALASWARDTHPNAKTPSVKTIQNQIRHEHRRIRGVRD